MGPIRDQNNNYILSSEISYAKLMWQNFEKIDYNWLIAKQKENFNFQKVAAAFADYGFNFIKLTDD